MTDDIILMKASNKDILQAELLEARNKLMTLVPTKTRQKRGLINAIGTISKWTFGTMDDYDRQTIQKHFLQTDETLNQQIHINDHFNLAIEQIKNIVKNDRKEIEKSFNAINKMEDQEHQQHMYLQQMSKIQLIKSKIEQIQDNVVSAKYGLVHPSILTNHEIIKYNIDFNKLKYLQLGIATFNNTFLILGIKIPKVFIQAKIRKIVPLPNKEQKEIEANIEEVFTYKNKTMQFEENKHFRQLKSSTHCITTKNCKLVTSKELEIIALDEKTIMIKNSVNLFVNNTCNKNHTILNGNYILQFNNCSIKINDYYFSNLVEKVEGNIMSFRYDDIKSFTEKLTFEQINEENKINFQNISNLKIHNKIIYGCNIFLILIIILVIAIWKTKFSHIKINLNNQIQENSDLKGRVVTYANTYVDMKTNEPDKFEEFLNEINKARQ